MQFYTRYSLQIEADQYIQDIIKRILFELFSVYQSISCGVQQKMAEILTKLYAQRLESLSQTLKYLHEIVGVDEALALLKDQRLVQYKMDRIGELVREVITSEKERIIIQLIQKIEDLQRKSDMKNIKTEEVDQSQLAYYRKRLEQKNDEIERLKNENNILKQQRDQNKKVYNQLKIQFEIYQNKYKQIRQKWENYEDLKSFEVKADKNKIEETIAVTKILEEQLQKQKNINRQNQIAKQNIIDSLKLQIESLTIKSQQNKQLSCKQKTEKIESLKKQIRKLSNDLNQMKEMTRIILNYINQSLSTQLQGVKKELGKLGNYITKQFKILLRQFANSFNDYQSKVKTSTAEMHDEQLIKRMQILQGELSQFIEVNKI